MTTKSPAQSNKSISDGFIVLQALASAYRPMGGRELARLLDMETTRVNRLLKTLASMDILQQTNQRKYEPGPGMHVLAAQSLHASSLLRHSMNALETLTSTGLIVALGVLWRDQVAYLYHRTPGMSAGDALGRIGSRPATMTGVGMALLADKSDEEITTLYTERDIPGFPEGPETLLERLDEIRSKSYAYIEVQPDPLGKASDIHQTIATTVGTPITAAIAVSGWIPEPSTMELMKLLNSCKETIEGNMGVG
ncbi:MULTISPECIES: helix-turn-helix domain-containing protein [unclassified Pseudovibrio]|uniref:IclR family transcriptional regulator n=1 Tax=unclassified Pseudovibrio TaxID=2627060 RepID=UPI0007AE39C6|nr:MULTISPECIES: helix-turn-helix domain-containing protein [unclassified Pseudovibrio]KZL01273.1 IclR helix-turn-helix domain protein [Pseudovibrio sp. W74]KZL11338.1 IclR helix-turn-helix domain protein [Pseudovibrio sp. Ad14]